MIQDLRYGIRMLLKHPWFTCTVVLTLALGVGAKTALFSIINALLLRPLPLPQPEQMVQVSEVSRQSGNQKFPVALPNMVDWRRDLSRCSNGDATEPLRRTLRTPGFLLDALLPFRSRRGSRGLPRPKHRTDLDRIP